MSRIPLRPRRTNDVLMSCVRASDRLDEVANTLRTGFGLDGLDDAPNGEIFPSRRQRFESIRGSCDAECGAEIRRVFHGRPIENRHP